MNGISMISHLECARCRRTFSVAKLQTFCPDCRQPFLARYDLPEAKNCLDRDEFASRNKGMWRWKELLPVVNPAMIVSLGEGDTPLLRASRLGDELGLTRLYIKEEGQNPTGSFKARGLSAAVSKAKELGVQQLIIPTAGNAGGALAAYAARGGLQAHIFMPVDTPRANFEECRITGASVVMVEGVISDAGAAAAAVVEQAHAEGKGGQWFDVSTFKEPYRTEGKKIMGYELAEAFGWELPEVIIYPTGGGTGLVGMWKAFEELEALGWLENTCRPRMVVVQAEGCAPVVKAFEAKAESCEFWDGARTVASGLRVPKSFADRLILDCLRSSQGIAVAVSDMELINAQRRMAAAEGVFAAPEGAATLAALDHLIKEEWVRPEDRVVLFNTGTGLKYL